MQAERCIYDERIKSTPERRKIKKIKKNLYSYNNTSVTLFMTINFVKKRSLFLSSWNFWFLIYGTITYASGMLRWRRRKSLKNIGRKISELWGSKFPFSRWKGSSLIQQLAATGQAVTVIRCGGQFHDGQLSSLNPHPSEKLTHFQCRV